MAPLDWVIIGGGPHGVCAARALREQGADLRIVEPRGELLHRWSGRARCVAMTWMRSPVGHHLDAHPADLHHFVNRQANTDVAALAGPLLRPTHDAFLRHTQHIIDRTRLRDAVITGRVESIRHDAEPHSALTPLIVEGPGVLLRTRRVLLATGTNRVSVPDWADRLVQQGAAIGHVFDDDAERMALDIIGGGISAVQRALYALRVTGKRVRLWARRPLQIADFDFEQAWGRTRFIRWWTSLDVDRRLAFFERHGARGSVPPGLSARLSRAIRRGQVELHHGAVRVERCATGLVLKTEQTAAESTGVTLATGLEPEHIPPWLQRTAAQLDLPVSSALPHLGSDMQWGRGIYVSGPLARLRLGPVAANLIGARWATSRLPGVKMQPT